MSKPVYTEDQWRALDKRRKVAERMSNEKPLTWIEMSVKASGVKAHDIVFADESDRPLIAAVDAMPSTGVEGVVIIRDLQSVDHYYPAAMSIVVGRPFDIDNPPKLAPEEEDDDFEAPWMIMKEAP